MTFASWLRGLAHGPATAVKTSPPSARRARGAPDRLRVERLEERAVMSAGVLDPTFDGDGIVTTFMGEAQNGSLSAAVFMDNGKIVVAGTGKSGATDPGDFALARFNSNGALDSTFGNAGKVLTTFGTDQLDSELDAAIAPDGKYVVVGESYAPHGMRGSKPINFNWDIAVARYNPDGTPDTTFSADGKTLTDFGSGSQAERVFAVLVQPDGKIIAGGEYVVPATKTAAAHKDWALVRYNLDGSLDTTFGSGGKVTTTFGASSDILNDMTFQTVDSVTRIVAVGESYNGSNYDLVMARYNLDGTLDSSFGQSGVVRMARTPTSDDTAAAVAIQADARIVIAGGTGINSDLGSLDIALLRYEANGKSLDSTFGNGGTAILTRELGQTARGAVLQPDGKILVTGTERGGSTGPMTLLARFNGDGSLDSTSFAGGGVVLTDVNPNDGVNGERGRAVTLQSDGAIVVAGVLTPTNGSSTQPSTWTVLRFAGDSPARALLAASTPNNASRQTLTSAQAQPLLVEALSRWQAAGVDTSTLGNLQIQISNLGGTTLGLASGNTIWLDDNAAGWGWFVDPTPGDDSEFTTPGDQGEQNRMDLLTVLAHEIGHLLGHDHDEGSVMAETLSDGTRLTPLVDATEWLAAVDVAFSKKSSSQWRWR